jgi:exopolysaccharide biosynthesis WecB/TagA/CpsF family protein
LTRRFPGLEIVGVSAPKFGFDPGSTAAAEEALRIAESGAGLCFVALGAPKQELFASAAMALAPKTAFVCIGAGLDYLAGEQIRAPGWVQAVGAEWLWRLLSAPGRLGRRYLKCLLVLPSLLWAVVNEPVGSVPGGG